VAPGHGGARGGRGDNNMCTRVPYSIVFEVSGLGQNPISNIQSGSRRSAMQGALPDEAHLGLH
jgi:hypothetical protein